MSTTNQTTEVTTQVTTPIPGVVLDKKPSSFIDRISGKSPAESTGDVSPTAKLDAARQANRPQVKKLPTAVQPQTTTTTTAEPETTTTTTAAPVEPPDKKPEKKARPVAKGYEKPVVSADVAELTKSVKALVDHTVKTAPKAPAEIQLTRKQERQIAILAEMEAVYPEAYKGLAQRSKELIPKLAEFEAEFKKKNPDAEPSDIEDALIEFEETHGVKFDPDDYDEAKIRVITNPLQTAIKERDETIAHLSKGEQRRQLAPKIAQQSVTAGEEVLQGFGEEFTAGAAAIADDGSIDQEAAEKFIKEAKDPLGAEIAIAAVQSAQEFSRAVTLAFNGEQTPLMDAVVEWCIKMENSLAQKAPEDTVNDQGQHFMRRREYARLSEAEKENYYILTPDLVSTCANDEIIRLGKADIDKERSRIERLGYKRATAAAPEPPVKPPTPVAKPVSPSSSNPTPPAPVAKPASGGGSTFMDRFKSGVASSMLQGRTRVR